MSTDRKAPSGRIVIAAAVLLTTALVLAVLATAGGGGEAPRRATGTAPATAPPSPSGGSGGPGEPRREDGDPYALGRVDAPVVMIEYSDFQCPFCGRFARETKPRLVREYVDRGVLRIEWRDLPVLGPESRAAAQAGRAAAMQGRFWQFHDRLYAEPRRRNSGAFADRHLVAWAREAGVPDLDRFRRDMASPKARDAVQTDLDEGYGIGAVSTPAFLINGEPLLGAQPFEVFAGAIEKARGR
ncbi:hypothetical protein GCM10023085_65630 [Actinomadura viridis]|uniref:Protein-disulfide isomerase n=1 Tax=Actinomadura viridis TaxID=58110 RepID=A0A931GRM8_9ACTN|nr:thioredoxin domain-containing protein [Actinomadura viridis]MBG6093021.1 protein-disulfide isomerase [Actinomadura viridis]